MLPNNRKLSNVRTCISAIHGDLERKKFHTYSVCTCLNFSLNNANKLLGYISMTQNIWQVAKLKTRKENTKVTSI